MNPRRTIVILLGGPGAGKGTQAQEIRNRLGIPPISTGQILRNEIARQSPVGIEAQTIINAGGLVSDDIVNRLVAERVRMRDCKHGFTLDGYPRDIDQAVAFKGELRPKDRLFVIDIDVDIERVMERLTSRLNCQSCGALCNRVTSPPRQEGQCDRCGGTLVRRADDREDVIRERFKAYCQQTLPLAEFYRKLGVYWQVDGMKPPESIAEQIAEILSYNAFRAA